MIPPFIIIMLPQGLLSFSYCIPLQNFQLQVTMYAYSIKYQACNREFWRAGTQFKKTAHKTFL